MGKQKGNSRRSAGSLQAGKQWRRFPNWVDFDETHRITEASSVEHFEAVSEKVNGFTSRSYVVYRR